MTGKSRPNLYDLLRLNFGNDPVEPGKLPGPTGAAVDPGLRRR